MFWKNMLKRTEVHHFADGSSTKPETREFDLKTCFQMVRALLMFKGVAPYVMGAVTTTSITYTEMSTKTHWMEIGGRRAESSTMTIHGSYDDMWPILQYVYLWDALTGGEIAGLDYEASRDMFIGDNQEPTYLPSLVILEVGLGSIHDVDKKILEIYGIDTTILERFKKTDDRRRETRDWGLWSDFCSANELWFENVSMSFLEVVEFLGLLDK